MNRAVSVTTVLILALLLLPSTKQLPNATTANPPSASALSQALLDIERDWTLNIILVDYDPNHIDEGILLSTFPSSRVYQTEDVRIIYNIDYHLYYASQSYTSDLRQEVLDNSVSGSDIGTVLNETALSIQRGDPNTPIRVFEPRDGRAIDGVALEDWLMENPYVSPPGLGYNFYLLNYSSLDTAGHEFEHWFDYAAADPDTGEMQDWFRLEFDHDLNPALEMQYPGIGGRGNIYVLDPSADQWYLRWTRIWWQDYIDTDYEHWTKDLEDKVREIDLETSGGVDSLSLYLRDYMLDIVYFLLFPIQHSPAKYVSTGELRTSVLCMDVERGVSVDSLRWVTDADMLKGQLVELYPFIQWNVQVDFIDINDEPLWNNTFWAYAEVNEDGVTEVDGSGMFSYLYDFMRPSRIPTGPDLINVFGAVFIKQKMLMYFGDGTYTGLGFNGVNGGQAAVWKSWERYYRSDNVTQREGVSGVLLHEVLHAVGFGHTWVHEHYVGDFSWGPMGYFAMHNGTASFDKNWVQGTYLDQMEALAWDDFLTWQASLGEDERPETYEAEENALECFSMARNAYNTMDWMTCYEMLSRASDWSKRMMYSTHDSQPPVIEKWGTVPTEVGDESFFYWAHVTDDTAGIENVTVYVLIDGGTLLAYPCEYESGNWSCTVEGLTYTHNASIWVEAWDWGMNSARGGEFAIPTTPTFPYSLAIGALAVSAGVLAIVVVLFVKMRRGGA